MTTPTKYVLEGVKTPLRNATGRRYFRGKIRLEDGTLHRIEIREEKKYDERSARNYLAWAQEEEDKSHALHIKIVNTKAKEQATVAGAAGELAQHWYGRYVVVHKSLGNGVEKHAGSWAKWCAEFFNGTPMTAITPAKVKAARDNLTRARLAGEIGAKRALNIWGDQIKTPFGRAFSDDDPKYASVRVGPARDNPALDIKPPVSAEDREEDERERQALEPAEFLALAACEERPLPDRRCDAVMTYSGLSPSEFYGLRKVDVRLDAERPHFLIQRGRDMKTGETTTTKEKQRNRRVPIHPELRPLLRVILDEADDAAPYLFPMANVRDVEARVEELRGHMKAAGVDRPELLEGTDTLLVFRCQVVPHDLRGVVQRRWLRHGVASCVARSRRSRRCRRRLINPA